MEYLPTEIIFNILIHIPYESIINFCLVNQQYYTILNDNNFWATKAHLEFNVIHQDFFNTNLQPSYRYVQLLTSYGIRTLRGSEKFTDINICLSLSSYQNNLSMVEYFLNKGATNLVEAFNEAILGKSLKVFIYLLDLLILNNKLTDQVLSKALISASSIGSKKILNYLISKGKEFNFPSIQDFNLSLYHAVIHDHYKIIDYLISLGANNFYSSLYEVSLKGNVELINYFIAKSHELNISVDANQILKGASYGGHIELITQSIRMGATDLNDAFMRAILGNQPITLDYLYSLDGNVINLNMALKVAVLENNQLLVDKLIVMGASNLSDVLISATSYGHLKMIEHLISLGATNLDEAFRHHYAAFQNEVIEYIINNSNYFQLKYPWVKLPTQVDLNKKLVAASKLGNLQLVKYLTAHSSVSQ